MNLFYGPGIARLSGSFSTHTADAAMAGKTLYDKLWDSHLVRQNDDGSALLYIDRHLLHEVTSPQAFEGLRLAGREPWRIDANLAQREVLAAQGALADSGASLWCSRVTAWCRVTGSCCAGR